MTTEPRRCWRARLTATRGDKAIQQLIKPLTTLASCLLLALPHLASAEESAIPASLTTPNKVETRIGRFLPEQRHFGGRRSVVVQSRGARAPSAGISEISADRCRDRTAPSRRRFPAAGAPAISRKRQACRFAKTSSVVITSPTAGPVGPAPASFRRVVRSIPAD